MMLCFATLAVSAAYGVRLPIVTPSPFSAAAAASAGPLRSTTATATPPRLLPAQSRRCRSSVAPRACATEAPPKPAASAAAPAAAAAAAAEAPLRVRPSSCPSCEDEWLTRSKESESEEQIRLAQIRRDNMSQHSFEVWQYGQRMNDTQRQELALIPDVSLRNFIIKSCTPPTPLMERVYNATMQRVPYEQACYICGPEQAMLLRTLVGLARPRKALDIGSFPGYASSAILEALPPEADLTCLEVDRDYTRLAAQQMAGRNANFMVGKAMDALKRFEAAGTTFDFISLDADKPQHGEYYNMSLKLLRPGGVLIMFGMLLFPTIEDQEAMEKLHAILPNDTRISTAQLPVGCGIQLMVKKEGLTSARPLSEAVETDRKRWLLESEIAAIDRYVDAIGKPLGGAASSGPGTEALSSAGLVALTAARREAEAAAAAQQAAAEAV